MRFLKLLFCATLIFSCPQGRTWEQHFIHWYMDMGLYIHCYAHLKKTWDKILAFFEKNCPLIFQTIQGKTLH